MICLVLSGSTIEENLKLVETNYRYIDIVELRVDKLNAEQQKRAKEFPALIDLPAILTIRRQSDGGSFSSSEKNRHALLEEALDGDFAYVDLEDDLKKVSIEQKAKEKNIKIIRSRHDFKGVPDDIFHLILKIASKGEIPKIATMPQGVDDLITLFRVKEELAQVENKIVVGMGEYGQPTRILYKKIGSLLTYCSSDNLSLGQVSAKRMKELYRADKIDDNTRIYGIIGNPVIHSFSPLIHNPGFQFIKFNAVYLPLTVDSVRSFFILAQLLQISGFSVTVPHKQAVLPYLGKITREVKQIGSCNTVVRTKTFWSGTNTDYYGFIAPLEQMLEEKRIKSALVVGAGGAARAVVWALRNHRCKVVIINRNLERAKNLAAETMATADSIKNASLYEDVDLIVQTTSVGMMSEEDPIADFNFNENHVVYELIYRPKYTTMMKRAKAANASLLFGIDMLIKQGFLQFEAFSGYHYPKRLKIEFDLEED
ncbi:MAG: shikimate dehydrogenase [Sphaerochaetaceae bacterium]